MSTMTAERATRKAAPSKQDVRTPFLTARNPYALTEMVLGKPIDWSAVDDPLALVEETLATPREELFDPRFESPVYIGFRLDASGEVVATKVEAPRERPAPESDESVTLSGDLRTLKDLTPLLGELDEVSVRRVIPARAGGWTIELAPGGAKRSELRDRIFDRYTLDKLVNLVELLDLGWTPDGGQWLDT